MAKHRSYSIEFKRQAARAFWYPLQPWLDPRRLVFIDETGAQTEMARLRGRAPRGERLIAGVPHDHWKTITLIAALRSDGIGAPMVIEQPMYGQIFQLWVEQVLRPTLKPDDIVIWVNLPAHKVAGARAVIEAAGARLLSLPAYSPDFNPIEQSSPSSRQACARPPHARSISFGKKSDESSLSSRQTNAPTISRMPATFPYDRILL